MERGGGMFTAYPELLLIDTAYKHNNLRMPLYLFNISGGEGHWFKLDCLSLVV